MSEFRTATKPSWQASVNMFLHTVDLLQHLATSQSKAKCRRLAANPGIRIYQDLSAVKWKVERWFETKRTELDQQQLNYIYIYVYYIYNYRTNQTTSLKTKPRSAKNYVYCIFIMINVYCRILELPSRWGKENMMKTCANYKCCYCHLRGSSPIDGTPISNSSEALREGPAHPGAGLHMTVLPKCLSWFGW